MKSGLQSSVFGCARRRFQRSLGLRSRSRGFTMIEVLVVIAIIALLAALMLTGLNVARERGRNLQARNDIEQVKTALSAYLGDYGALPEDLEETGEAFVAVMRGGNRKGYTYMDFHERSRGMRDPWENFYRFRLSDADAVQVWSLGPDEADGTEDDVKSWRE